MRLSLEEMKRIILVERGSVCWNTKVINNIADLPTEAEMALGDPEKEAEAKISLQKQADAIKEQLRLLEESAKEKDSKKVVKEKKSEDKIEV